MIPKHLVLIAFVASLVTMLGCASSFETLPGDLILAHSPACQKLDGRRRTAGTVAATAIGLSVASSAMAAILAKDHPDTALKVSVGGVAAGGVAGGATWYETDAASTYKEMCPTTAPTPAQAPATPVAPPAAPTGVPAK
jgi:hypothetical protein